MAVKQTIPFNFDEVYAHIEKKFEEKGYDTEEGSNTMQLVTAMAYMTSMLNANTAANVNETILTLARKRKMALYDARVLGYEVSHIQSYRYNLTLEFSEPGTYRINKYDEFTSGDKTYYYMGNTTDSFVVSGTPVEKTIEVIEGTRKSYEDEDTLRVVIENEYDTVNEVWYPQYFVDLPFRNIEEDGIEVFLTYYNQDGDFFRKEEWTKTNQYMIDADSTLNKEFVRLDDIEYGTSRIYFKIGDIGRNLRVGTIVEMNALISSGEEGAITSTPVPTSLNATVTNYELVVQGAGEESIDSIKQNAPLFNNTANRVVTKSDYLAFCNRQTSVKYTDAWDGQDEYPGRPGYVWLSFIPSTTSREFSDSDNPGYTWTLNDYYDLENWYIEDSEVANIENILSDYKIPTLRYKYRNPTYLDFDYDIKIARYNIKTSETDINEEIFNLIDNYFENGDTESGSPAETFDFEYFQSNLIKRIDKSLTDIMGFDITLKTSINLNERLVNTETFEPGDTPNQEIIFHLDFPYETLFDGNNDVIFANIPDIGTENFIASRNLYLDESSIDRDTTTEITSIDIKLSADGQPNDPNNDEIIGQMRIVNKSTADIEVRLYITSLDGYSVGIDPTLLEYPETIVPGTEYGLTLNVQYPSSNISFLRNTLPRLKSVNFI
ncbi:baseplate protein [Vibrio phage VB_VaC_TDDLMA]